ncbi:hypothetical protein GCM10009760_26220 [Kitasatospora kazusensis]|uniref:AAA domain-containing protein n=1 Tax=Kitasatospora kazusensis TaxID=407974 RepID=A0ABN2ZGC5_9ACTN
MTAVPWTGEESLIALVHGESGAGKTPVAHTAPKPLLVLDAENGSRFVHSSKVRWDPLTQAPPEPGDWETCIVATRDYATLDAAYRWLASGKHPFRSVALDSLTEIQKRCKDSIAGPDEQFTEAKWGSLLARMERLMRDFRDLTMHPTNPLQAVVFVALTGEKQGKYRPLVQGGLSLSLAGFVDVIGFLYVGTDDTGQPARMMLVQPTEQHVAKDRTGAITAAHGAAVPGPIDLAGLIATIYAPEAARV